MGRGAGLVVAIPAVEFASSGPRLMRWLASNGGFALHSLAANSTDLRGRRLRASNQCPLELVGRAGKGAFPSDLWTGPRFERSRVLPGRARRSTGTLAWAAMPRADLGADRGLETGRAVHVGGAAGAAASLGGGS